MGTISAPKEHLVEDARSRFRQSEKKAIERKPRKKKKLGTLLVVSLTILAFSLTLISADLLSGRAGLAEYVSLFTRTAKTEHTTYYAVYATRSEDMGISYKNAAAVRTEGGGGYVLKQDGQYYVILNVYKEENDAKTVAERSANYAIYEIIVPFPNEKKTKEVGIADSTIDLFDESYSVLYQTANDLASGKFGKEDMKRALESQKQRIVAAENAYSESVKGQEDNGKIEYKVFLAQLRSAFENLIEEEENLVSDARYYSVMILHYYSLFANKYLA